MLEKSFGLLYYLKQPKNQKGKDRFVYLRITVDGKPKEVSIKRRWHCDKWNQRAGRATGNKEDARSLNEYLESLTSKIYEAKKLLIDTGRRITALGIISIVTGSGQERRMVVDIFKQHNKIIEGLIGVEFSRKTWQRYDTACTHLQNYIKFKTEIDIDGVDMELRDVNYDFIQQYYYWLRISAKVYTRFAFMLTPYFAAN